MKETVYKVELTIDELLRLDGVCGPDVQAVVERAKHAAVIVASGGSAAVAKFVADAVAAAVSKGMLTYSGCRVSYCSLCAKSAGYQTYKSGRSRGWPNYDKPLYLSGIDLDAGFVRMTGCPSIGCCLDCMESALPLLRAALRDVKAELPEQLRAAGVAPWKRWRLATCHDCGWSGHEGQLRLLRTPLGDGYYRGGCANCSAENTLGRHPVEFGAGFAVVPVERGMKEGPNAEGPVITSLFDAVEKAGV